MKFHYPHLVQAMLAASIASLGVAAGAQFINANQAIEVEADSTGADARSGALRFTNITIRQGGLKISAREAESSALGFENSTWTFDGDVVLTSPTAQLRAQSLILTFASSQLDAARLRGNPFRYRSSAADNTDISAAAANAVFSDNQITAVIFNGQPIELSRLNSATGKITRARADEINYNATSRNLELTGNAELNEDGNIITGNQITYDIGGQTVLAAGDGEGNDRVHITIRPRDPDSTQEAVPVDAGSASEEETSAPDEPAAADPEPLD